MTEPRGGADPLPVRLLDAAVVEGVWDPRVATELPRVSPTGEPVVVRADRSTALVAVRGVADYLVQAGELVTVARVPGAEAAAVRLWLHGTVTALLAGQQGRFALHASVVSIAGRAVAVAGGSGAGKSTTVLAAAAAGGRIVSDDVAILVPHDGAVEVVPYGRRVHVDPDTAARLGLALGATGDAGSDTEKVAIQVPDPGNRRVDAVVVLRKGDVAEPRVSRLDGLRSVRAVRHQTFRPRLLAALYPDELFHWQVTIARRLAVHRLVRPQAWSAAAVVAELEGIARGDR